MTTDTITGSARIWDLPVRLFHWLLVLLFALLWATGRWGGLDLSLPLPGGKTLFLTNMDLHMLFGQAVLALVVFRLLWGVVGSTTARFSAFVRGPRAVLGYLKEVLGGRPPAVAGHNPAGGLMVLLLLVLLLLQSGTGLFANDELFSEGPLAHLVDSATSSRLTALHGRLFDLLLVAVAVHVAANLVYLLRGQNLIRAMVTGRGKVPADMAAGLRWAPLWLAALLLGVAVLAVVLLGRL